MKNRIFIAFLISFTFCFHTWSQEDEKKPSEEETTKVVIVDSVSVNDIDPLAPSRAAFYSAILPGLGQAYNKKYWKIPIVYAALGTSMYFYIDNNNQYKRYRNAYKQRLAGIEDEFYGRVTDDGLRRAQTTLRRNKEISLLVTIGFYVLNIIDANVDAHLQQFNVDDNLSFEPVYERSPIDGSNNFGLGLNFKF
ncbi:MAG: hypothetical protein KDD13_00110 [Mangrovimonas sp.]|nr:hypothetical protein [Mangrovimonas sp.]